MLEHFRTLLRAQPIAGPESKLLDTFHPADPGSEFRAEQAGVGGFVREPSHGCKLLVDRVGGETARFQMHAVANDHDAVESQSRLGAIPSNELIDGVLVQVWQPEHSATIIWFDSLFAHDNGLPCRSIGSTADRLGNARATDAGLGFEC